MKQLLHKAVDVALGVLAVGEHGGALAHQGNDQFGDAHVLKQQLPLLVHSHIRELNLLVACHRQNGLQRRIDVAKVGAETSVQVPLGCNGVALSLQVMLQLVQLIRLLHLHDPHNVR